MRVHVGAGYRVYFTQIGLEIFILLAGGNKSSQQADIDIALDLAKQLKGWAMLKLSKWDSAEHLKTEEDIALYLDACFEEAADDDAPFIAKALGTVARARGMTQLARDTGLGRESLYKALSGEGNPSFETILKVTRALGLRITVAQG